MQLLFKAQGVKLRIRVFTDLKSSGNYRISSIKRYLTMQTHMYKGQISLCKKQNYTLIKRKSGDGEEGEINIH